MSARNMVVAHNSRNNLAIPGAMAAMAIKIQKSVRTIISGQRHPVSCPLRSRGHTITLPGRRPSAHSTDRIGPAVSRRESSLTGAMERGT